MKPTFEESLPLEAALAPAQGARRPGVAVRETPEGVLVVTLNRPERLNALDLDSWRDLGALFAWAAAVDTTAGRAPTGHAGGTSDAQADGVSDARAAAVPTLRAVVIRGAGGAFSAGADISEFPRRRMVARAALDYNRAIARALEAVVACPVPVIAMIGGAAVGGGCELAAACDVRIASTRARFGVPIGRLGVTLGPVEATAVARLIGPARLKELVFSSRIVDADEAHRIGLVERLVAPAELERETAGLLDAIVSASPATIRATKRVAALAGRDLTPADAEAFAELLFSVYEGAELAEGVAAFGERRPPRFAAAQAAPAPPAPSTQLRTPEEEVPG